MVGPEFLQIEVAFARPDRQLVLVCDVPVGTTAREAVRLSGIEQEFPELDREGAKLGIFGKPVRDDRILEAGDRVELYRPLVADPREVRRRLAAEGKTMGRKRSRR